MNNTTIHVGLDVHKKTTAVAVSQGLGRARFIGMIDSNPRALLKVLGKLGDAQEMSVVYEAGSYGYDLYRRFRYLPGKVRPIGRLHSQPDRTGCREHC